MHRSSVHSPAETNRLGSWWLVGLAVVILVAFAPVRHFDFVSWDDTGYVTQNPHVLAGLSWDTVRWALSTGDGYYWHPLTWISHLLDVQWFGLDSGAHHVTNLLLHLANTLLLFAWLRTATGEDRPSAFVAALFALHPAHVESFAWIAERKDVLSTFFLLLTLLAYTAYSRRPSRRAYVAVLVLFALGLAAKPMLVTLPVLLLLVDIWPGQRLGRENARTLLVEKLPLLVLAVLSAVVTVLNQHDAGAVRTLTGFPLALRLTNALASLAGYLRMLAWPSGLSAFYPYPSSLPLLPAAAGLTLLLGVTAFVVRLRHRFAFAFVGWLWFLVSLLPVIGLIQAGDQAMADRFTYVSYIGLFVAVAWGAAALSSSIHLGRQTLTAMAVVVIAALAIASRGQVMHWKNSEALWSHAAAVTADNEYAHANLALLFEAEGRLPEATREYREAARIADEGPSNTRQTKPGAARLHNQAGILLMRQNQATEAVREFQAAVKAEPNDPATYHNLGIAMERLGRVDDAIEAYRQSVARDARAAESRASLALLLASKGRLNEAIALHLEAVALEPRHADWHYNLGAMLEQAHRRAEALAHYSMALQIQPHHPLAEQALLELTGEPAPR